jgi:hypothetical protein
MEELKGWEEYIHRKNEIREGASIQINGSYRLVSMNTLIDRYRMGGTEWIHNPKINLTFKIVEDDHIEL